MILTQIIKSQSQLELARHAEQALRLGLTRVGGRTVAIEPDYPLILDVVDQRTPGSAAWYDECYAAAAKLSSSSEQDEEGD